MSSSKWLNVHRSFILDVCLLLALSASNSVGQTISPAILAKVSRSVVRITVFVPPGAKWPDTAKWPEEMRGKFEQMRKTFEADPVFVMGSGFFVNDRGDIVTAAHVVRGAELVLETLHAQNVEASLMVGITAPSVENKQVTSFGYTAVSGRVSDIDNSRDLALLRVARNPFNNSHAPKPKPGTLVISGQSMPSVATISQSRPKDAESIFTCGFPLGTKSLITTVGTIASAWIVRVPVNAAELGGQGTARYVSG
ncbi:MAG: serine protease [Bryocella sp.]